MNDFLTLFLVFCLKISYSYDIKAEINGKFNIDQKIQSGILTVEQNIFNGGSTVAKLKAAQSLFRAAQAKYYVSEQKTIFNLIQNYISCYEAKEKYHISESSVRYNKQQLESMEEKLNLGEATPIELYDAKANLAKAESIRLSSYARLQANNANFVKEFEIELDNISMPAIPGGITKLKEYLMQKSISINPDIKHLRHAVKSYKANELVTKAELLPKVSLEVQARKDLNNPINFEAKKRKSVNSVISVNIPIYSHGAEYSAIRKTKNNTQECAILLDKTIKQIQAQVIESWEGFEAAKSNIIHTKQGVEAAQIAYDGGWSRKKNIRF